MEKKLSGILVVALLALGVGCGNDNVPTLDIHEDATTLDVAADTVTPVDTNVNPDVREDVATPDTAVEDTNVTPDVAGEDTNVTPDTAGEDVPADVTADVAPTVCTSNADCDGTEFCEADACGGEGVCTAKPALCLIPAVIENICACDGVIYDSECFAAMAGANVGTGADCGGGDSCTQDTDCASDEYCNKDTCAAANGTCALKATLCPLIINPVCGCDGTTYNNACLASANGINVDETGVACSGVTTCTTNGDCGSGFCYKTTCEAGAEGTCEGVPSLCLVIGSGICGCDGVTYINECLAQKAQVSTDSTGAACDAEVTCSSNADCQDDEYCDKETCGAVSGTCTAVPLTCKVPIIDSEVCGCDGVVYPSACYAHRGRVSTEDIGECTSSTVCTVNLDCGGKSKYCLHEACAAKGTCATHPMSCEDATLYVCGCDDQTYKNPCEAAKAGISVSKLGKCGISL